MTQTRLFFVLVALVVSALLAAGCVSQRLPQEQAQRADRIGPLHVHVHADYNVLTARGPNPNSPALNSTPDSTPEKNPDPNAAPQAPTTQPDLDKPRALVTHNSTTMTVHISTQGSSTQAQTATGGSPGPVNNTPSVSVPVSVSTVP